MHTSIVRNGFAIVAAAILSGCDQTEPPPEKPSALKNTEHNQITERETLVREFQSAEVMLLPYITDQFIVRDTNQAIWLVSWQSNIGHTMLFKGSAPVSPSPFWMDTKTVDATLGKLKQIQELLANIENLRLKVILTNNTIDIEDADTNRPLTKELEKSK
jgi:hypothetical protein